MTEKGLTFIDPQNVILINKKLEQDIPISDVFRIKKNFQEEVDYTFRTVGTRELFKVFKHFDIQPLNPGDGDIFANKIIRVQGYEVIIICFEFLLIGLLPAIASILEGHFLNAIKLATINDVGYWNQMPISIPIVVLVISTYFNRLPRSLFELVIQGVFPITREQWNNFTIRVAPKIYRNNFVRILPYIVGLICTIFLTRLYFFNQPGNWNNVEFSRNTTIAGCFLVVDVFLLYFLFSLAVIRIISTSIVLIKFFNFKPNIQPLHPDSSGGLSPLGKLSMSLNLGVFLYGFFCVIGIYANHYNYGYDILFGPNILIMTAYVLAASVLFFFPLFAAHNCMKEAKYKTIQIINFRFEQANSEVIESLNKTSMLNKKTIENLEALQKMYEVAQKMPVFPFNMQTVSSFFGSIFTPVLIYIAQVVASQYFHIK